MNRLLYGALTLALLVPIAWLILEQRSSTSAPALELGAAPALAPASAGEPGARGYSRAPAESVAAQPPAREPERPEGELAPLEELVVRVESHDGIPLADAYVFVIRASGEDRLRPTDGEGEVLVPLKPEDRSAETFSVRAACGELLRSSIVRSKLRELAEPRVTVRMPPAGFIELELRLAPGVDPASLEPTPAYVWDLVDGRPGAVQGMRIDEARIAHSGPIPLGRRYRVSIDTPKQQADLDGPTIAGEVVRHSFELGADRILLTGRIVGADGRPKRSALLRLRSNRAQGIKGVLCQPNGEFVFVVEHIAPGKAIEVCFEHGGNGQPKESAIVQVPPLSIGRNDVGNVFLLPTAPIASGRVIGPDGAPVAGAQVVLLTGIQLEDPNAAPIWSQSGSAASTAADGTFVLDGPAPAGRLGLAAVMPRGPGFLLARISEGVVELHPPASGLELLLTSDTPRGR